MLTPDEYFRFWSALQAEGGDRDLALDVGQAISVETFSPPIMAALCSPTLTVAAQRIATYKPLVGPLHLDVTDTEAGLCIAYQWPPDRRPPTLLATSERRRHAHHHVPRRRRRPTVPDRERVDVALLRP